MWLGKSKAITLSSPRDVRCGHLLKTKPSVFQKDKIELYENLRFQLNGNLQWSYPWKEIKTKHLKRHLLRFKSSH